MTRRTCVRFRQTRKCRAARAPPVPEVLRAHGWRSASLIAFDELSVWADRVDRPALFLSFTGDGCSAQAAKPHSCRYRVVRGGSTQLARPSLFHNEEFRHGEPEDPDSAEGVRSSPDRPVGQRDRRDGQAHRRAVRGPVPLPTKIERLDDSASRRTSTRTRATSTRSARTSA